jgi:lipid-A-disaccharide synthase-like uncharacterized protein
MIAHIFSELGFSGNLTLGQELWLVVGFIAQLIFSLRFIVQWIASERAGKSVMPVAFWFISMLGGFMLLAYAIYRRDPVFILGQATGAIVYFRNLVLIYREKGHATNPS